MAQRAGRITCPRCGANNFDTVTSCWKCGAPVGAAANAAPVAVSAPIPASAAMPVYPQERTPQAVVAIPQQPDGDAGMARRAAAALGLLLPFIGLPVGWIFMMIQDRRKQEIGRWCATWSLISLVFHLFAMFFLAQQSVPLLLRILTPAIEGAARRNAGGSDGLPGNPGLP